ncbi:hypothetical protein E2C01_084476 [Portunus trituberculatus]|uniref:Uncharacterized protein n=1 Tax=Portunus trituberculatus TaxID=210409 RepID=A0A5B7J440_PORTR|nr:hypothetical protein [Portunus trituberculatus]
MMACAGTDSYTSRPSSLSAGRWRLSDGERRRQEAEALSSGFLSLSWLKGTDGLPGNRSDQKGIYRNEGSEIGGKTRNTRGRTMNGVNNGRVEITHSTQAVNHN